MQIESLERLLKNLMWLFSSLLIFMIVFENQLVIPHWLYPIGRLHPMILHFPIVLIVLLAAWMAFSKAKEHKYVKVSLYTTALVVIVTSIMGLFLSLEDSVATDLMFRHKWSALVLTIIMVVSTGVRSPVSRILIVLALPVVIVTGHFGGSITHGENFVFEPWETPGNLAEGLPIFNVFVEPVLNDKCTGCHNPNKLKGELDLTSFSKMVEGGESGPIWNLNAPDSSRILKKIRLPLEHEDHMPPEGKNQLTQNEINLLTAWINSGADTATSIAALQPDHALYEPVTLLKEYWEQNAASDYDFEFADIETINNLNNSFRSVDIYYPGAPALEASFFVRSAFSINALKELLAVKEQIISLDLGYMPITDQDLEIIGQFKNLEKLNLNFTDLRGTGFENLLDCKSLRSLSLAGTGVNANFLTDFANLDALDVFLWETQAQIGKDSLPENITIYYGYSVEDEDPIALTPPLLQNDRIIGKNEKIILEHNFPGTEIHYTTDNTTPDSTSKVYNNPIEIHNIASIRAIALKEGWLQSKEVVFEVFKAGLVPDSLKLLTPPDPKNPGKLEKTLVDFEKGEISDFGSEKWLGYRENPMELWIDLGDQHVAQIALAYGVSIGSYIMPPEAVELWVSDDNLEFKMIERVEIPQPDGYGPSFESFVEFNLKATRYCKIKVFPVGKLPNWHSGKGEKGWVFVDELFLF